MCWFFVGITILLIVSNLITFFIVSKKTKKLNDIFEDQKFQMAEANLKLLEQSEQLEDQKFQMAEANLKLLESNEIIEMERARSEKLLLNILPARVASDLKEKGTTEPECFDEVTVYFSDIVGFTDLSSRLEPHVLIAELNDIFTAFDKIIQKNSCERIKTIGDAYLCVCGMPVNNPEHAVNILNSAIEMMSFLEKRNQSSPLKWNIRAGVHSGKVVGGVVGVEKYIYDVFGDTINTASRMEANSLPMKVNVSEKTYMLARDNFKFTERGLLEVKGKGKIKMYFLEF